MQLSFLKAILMLLLLSGFPPQPGPRSIRVASANCNTIANKLDHFKALVYSEKLDIILIQESKVPGNVPTDDIGLRGFTTYRRDRDAQGQGGGLLTYVSDDLLPSLSTGISPTGSELLAVDIRVGSSEVTVLNMYCPPRSTTEKLGFLDDLTTVLSDINSDFILAGGDLNIDLISDLPSQCCRTLQNFMGALGMQQHIQHSTHGGKLIDHVWASDSVTVSDSFHLHLLSARYPGSPAIL